MANPTTPVTARLKSVATLIAALTALVTACTSLVKATDKRVEQVSYETLSRKIVETQDANAALRKEMEALHGKAEEEVQPPPPLAAPSASVAAPFGADAGHPLPPHVPSHPWTPPASTASARRLGPLPLPPAPPPPWKAIKDHADQM